MLTTIIAGLATLGGQGTPATDLSSIDSLLSSLYAVISGPAGQKRDWDKMRSLFLPGAPMGMVYTNKAGQPKHFDFDVEKYIELSAPALEKEGFFEKELGRRTDQFDRIAQVFSSYASVHKLGEKPFESGINSLQLVNDGKRWWIKSIVWEGTETGLKIPRQYLKRS